MSRWCNENESYMALFYRKRNAIVMIKVGSTFISAAPFSKFIWKLIMKHLVKLGFGWMGWQIVRSYMKKQ
jgi:hypothetical protein